MNPLMTAALADKTESLAYRSEPTMTEPMNNETAAQIIERLCETALDFRKESRSALNLAIAALRADGWSEKANVNYWRDRASGFQIDLQELTDKFASLDETKCEFVSLYRAAEAKLERTWRVVEMYQDRLAEEE